jgi:hypothetical protein
MNHTVLHIEILIIECLDACWMEWFAGFSLVEIPDGHTRLSGDVADRAALHGVLERIRDLNLSLVSVQVTDLPKKG